MYDIVGYDLTSESVLYDVVTAVTVTVGQTYDVVGWQESRWARTVTVTITGMMAARHGISDTPPAGPGPGISKAGST